MNTTTFQYEASDDTPERALLITIRFQDESERETEYRSDELRSLVKTMGMIPEKEMIVTVREPKSAYLMGTGKMQEIIDMSRELDIECIVIDKDITPSQQRNWEKAAQCAVIDRREVILQIFADRAQTREAVLQSALARQEYSLPRLTRAWTHLSRQRGGTKGTRGEGEAQLEIDRRIAMKKIAHLKEELKKVRAHRETQRKQRRAIPVPTGSIVGYTNAGKSSLLKALSGADVFIEDKLFATLDTTTKRILLPGGSEVLLTDTVGFVRDLPHNLVDAFRSTLEEAVYADFIIHILDASHPDAMTCYQTTMEVLSSLHCDDRPMIVVCNKMDLCEDRFGLQEIISKHPDALFTSVKQNDGLEEILQRIEALLFDIYPVVVYRFPSDRFDLIAYIRRNGVITDERYDDQGRILVTARVPEQYLSGLSEFVCTEPPHVAEVKGRSSQE